MLSNSDFDKKIGVGSTPKLGIRRQVVEIRWFAVIVEVRWIFGGYGTQSMGQFMMNGKKLRQ